MEGQGWAEGPDECPSRPHQHDSLSKLLRACIAFTGDVDTIAAIAMGAASNSEEIDQDLPEHLVAELEDDRYGRSFLIQLDGQLRDQFALPQP